MANYTSKKQAEKALVKARKKLVTAREVWKKDKSDKNKAEMDKCLKECVDIQHVLDRWF